MTSPVSGEDIQISRSAVGVCGKRVAEERIRGVGHLRASVVWVPAWGHVPPWAQSPLRGQGTSMELGPFSWAGCRGQHAKRQCRSLTSLTPGVLGPPITAWLSPLLPPSPACPQVTSEQAGGAREANPLARGSPGHGAALVAGYTCFCLALAMFAHPGPLLSARG